MSQRELRDEKAAKTSSDGQKSLVEQVAKSRMDRLSGAGVSGIGASTMAFVVGGCLALGFFAGSWLDGRFNTSYWMPIGVGLGLAASVREMFRTLKQLNAQTQREQKQREIEREQRAQNANAPREYRTNEHRVLDDRVLDAKNESAKSLNAAPRKTDDAEPKTIRPRIFHVPPPPSASFDVVEKSENAHRENAHRENLKLNRDELLELLRADTETGDNTARERKRNGD